MKKGLGIFILFVLWNCVPQVSEPSQVQILGTFSADQMVNSNLNESLFWVAYNTDDEESKAQLECFDADGNQHVKAIWEKDNVALLYDAIFSKNRIYSVFENNTGQLIYRLDHILKGTRIDHLVMEDVQAYKDFKLVLNDTTPYILGVGANTLNDLSWFMFHQQWHLQQTIGYFSVDENLKEIQYVDGKVCLMIESIRAGFKDVRCVVMDTLGLVEQDLHYYLNDDKNQSILDFYGGYFLMETIHTTGDNIYELLPLVNQETTLGIDPLYSPYCFYKNNAQEFILVNFYYNGIQSYFQFQKWSINGFLSQEGSLILKGFHEPQRIRFDGRFYYLLNHTNYAFETGPSLLILNQNFEL